MSLFINYGLKTIVDGLKNIFYLEDNNPTSNKSYKLDLKTKISFDQLAKQAKIFGLNLRNLGYFDLRKILDCETKDIQQIIEEIYIYSAIKSIFNGFNSSNIRSDKWLGYAFRGHCALFETLSCAGGTHIDNDFFISFGISKPTLDESRIIGLKTIKAFPFLKQGFYDINTNSFGSNIFYIASLEEKLARLRNNFYAQEHVKFSAQGGEKGDFIRSKVEYSSGKIEIFELGNSESQEIMEFKNTPVFNSFLKEDSNEFFYIPVGNGKEVLNNPSLFFNNATFFRASKNNNDFNKINSLYSRRIFSTNMEHTICSEIFTITGLKCVNFSSGVKSSYNTSFKFPSLENIINFVKSDDARDLLDVIDDILNKIEEIDSDEISDEMLSIPK